MAVSHIQPPGIAALPAGVAVLRRSLVLQASWREPIRAVAWRRRCLPLRAHGFRRFHADDAGCAHHRADPAYRRRKMHPGVPGTAAGGAFIQDTDPGPVSEPRAFRWSDP